MTNPVIPMHLYQRQARITSRERSHVNQSFGELTPAALKVVLDEAQQGDISNWIDLCKHMTTTDPKLFNKLDIRKRRVISALKDYRIVPGKDPDPALQAQAATAAKFCTDIMSEVGFYEMKLLKILDAIGQGVSTTQLIWGRKHGANIITDLEWVHTRRFRWDSEWRLRLYDYGEHMQDGEYGEELERDCWMIMLCEEEGTYPGEAGVLRKCAWPWNFKMWVNRYHIHATERYGQPFITATTPAHSKGSVDSDVLQKLEQLSYDTVGVFEEGTQVVFEGGPSTVNNGEMFERYLQRADECQAEAVLGATDITAPGENGARAAVETREEATLDPKTITDLALLHGCIREQIFKPLLRYNMHLFGGVVPPTPVYKSRFEREEKSYEMPTEQQEQATGSDDNALQERLTQQEISLNGAQIASLLEVLQNVGAGIVPRESAIALIKIAFNLSEQQALNIVGTMGTAGAGAPTPVQPEAVTKTPETVEPQAAAPIENKKKNSIRSNMRTAIQQTLPLCRTPSAIALSGESVD